MELELPTECPCCKKVLAADIKPIVAVNNLNINLFEPKSCKIMSIYRCTSCNELFVMSNEDNFVKSKKECDETINIYNSEVKASFPINEKITIFEDDIKNLSNSFVEVYNQAEKAETYGLNEICGMGYRRSLEFLIDDYIEKKLNVSINKDKPLSQKINDNFNDNPEIKTLAERATWLGNDATHIINKHPECDINDMKKFILAIVKYIEFKNAVADAETIPKR